VGGILEHPPHAFHSQNIGDFVWIRHRRDGSMRGGQTSEFSRRKHRAFDMDVSVHEAGSQIRGLRLGDLVNRGDATVPNRDGRWIKRPAMNVDQIARYLQRAFPHVAIGVHAISSSKAIHTASDQQFTEATRNRIEKPSDDSIRARGAMMDIYAVFWTEGAILRQATRAPH